MIRSESVFLYNVKNSLRLTQEVMAGGRPASNGSIGASLPRGSEGVGRGRKQRGRLRPAKPLDTQKRDFTRD